MTHHFLSHSTTEFITLGERETRKCLSSVASSQQHLSTVDLCVHLGAGAQRALEKYRLEFKL